MAMDVAVSDPGKLSPRSGDGASAPSLSSKRLRRGIAPTLAMAPFVIYTFLGLGIPTLAIINLAFRTEQGKPSLVNIRTIVHGTYLVGFENSLLLSAISSIIPGILGVFLAYAIETSHFAVLRRLASGRPWR